MLDLASFVSIFLLSEKNHHVMILIYSQKPKLFKILFVIEIL